MHGAWRLAALAGAGLAATRGRVGAQRFWAVGLACAAGAVAMGTRLETAVRWMPTAPREASVEARVGSLRRTGDGWIAELRDAVAVPPSAPVPSGLRLRGRATPAPHAAFEAVPVGTRVRARLRLRPPPGPRNPGSDDLRRRLARRGIGALATLAHPALHREVSPAGGARAGLAALRRRGASALTARGRGGALLAALAFGEGHGLGPEVRETWARLGLSHLLAVSGLHLALVSGLAYTVARRLWLRLPAGRIPLDPRRAALAPALAAALAYAALTGLGVPVRRALLLLAALVLAAARRRPLPSGHALVLAAAALLVAAPGALFEPGAQLSFAACAALVWSTRIQDAPGAVPAGRVRAVGRTLRRVVDTSAVATAATTPFAALHFGLASPFGWLSNAVAVPFTAGVLLPGALASGALAELAPASPLLDLPVRGAAGVLDAVARVSARIPAAEPGVAPLWALVVAGALAVATVRSGSTPARIAGAVAAGGVVAAAPPPRVAPVPPRAVFLDVGQGDAALVQGRRAAVLVDAGTAAPDGWDAGRFQVVPALRALGVERLDLVIASHADLDHRGGLPAVLRGLPTARVWVPPGGARDPAFARVRAAAWATGAALEERGRGDPPLAAGDLRVEPLWPPRGPHGGSSRSRNDASLVVRIAAGKGACRVLLAGDVGAAAERALVSMAGDPRAAVLKLAHHGSRTSSSGAWLDAVAPRLAVVSAPRHSRFGMPHPSVRARLSARDIPVAWTGRDGAVLVGLGSDGRVRGWGAAPGGGRPCAPRGAVRADGSSRPRGWPPGAAPMSPGRGRMPGPAAP